MSLNVDDIKEVHVDYFRDIPISDVLNLYGERPKMGKFRCPAPDHQDNNPSAAIFKNNPCRFKCFACNQGGDAISLVEFKEGLGFKEACVFLYENGLVPKEAFTLREEQSTSRSPVPELPFIDPDTCKVIGLKGVPKVNLKVSAVIGERECLVNGSKEIRHQIERKDYQIEAKSLAELVFQKLVDYKVDMQDYGNKVIRDFPDLSDDARNVIRNTVAQNLVRIDYYIDEYLDYIESLEKYDPLDFANELERLGQMTPEELDMEMA